MRPYGLGSELQMLIATETLLLLYQSCYCLFYNLSARRNHPYCLLIDTDIALDHLFCEVAG